MPQVISKALQVVFVPVGFKKSPRLEGAGWRHWLASSSELSIRASIRVHVVPGWRSLVATGDFEGLAGCVCTCRVQKVTETGGRRVAALAGFIQ